MSTRDSAAREISAGDEIPDQPSPPHPDEDANTPNNNTARSVSRLRISGEGISPPADPPPDQPHQPPPPGPLPAPITSHPRNCVSLERLLWRITQANLSADQAEAADMLGAGGAADPDARYGASLSAEVEALDRLSIEQQAEAFDRAEHPGSTVASRAEGWREFKVFLHGRARDERERPDVARQRRDWQRAQAERRKAEIAYAAACPVWLDGPTASNRLGGISLNALVQMAKRHHFAVWKVKGRNNYLESDIEAQARKLGLRAGNTNAAA